MIRYLLHLMLCLGFTGWGTIGWTQTCEQLKADASKALKERDQAQMVNEDLHKELALRVGKARRMSLPLPRGVLAKVAVLDPKQISYQDEQGRCRFGTSSWGTIKDLREYKRDSLDYENGIILGRIQMLQAAMDEAEAALLAKQDEPTREPIPYTQPRSISAQRRLFQEKAYAYCLFDPLLAEVQIAPMGIQGAKDGFDQIEEQVRREGKNMILAMNAGMYEADKSPVGLLIQRGLIKAQLNQREGRGNFYMQPNGVFGILNDGRAFVLRTQTFASRNIPPQEIQLATQSGPVMLLNGKVNPKFTQGSANLHFRNAVGIRNDGQVVFAISEQR
ncbi:MAG: phosphodiester glycosidase family protein, partial [Bacteroidota bacterium]